MFSGKDDVELSGACRAISKGKLCKGKITKFDRLVDPNVGGAKRLVYSDLRIFCN